MSSPSARPRLVGADVLRALCVVGVITVHAAHWPSMDSGVEWSTWQNVITVARFSVPCFVVLSGILIGVRGPRGARDAGFIGRRIRRTLVPFVAWAPIYCGIGLFLTGEITPTASGVSGWWSAGAGHLYYLILVPQLYVLALLWPRSARAALVVAVVFVVVQTALDMWRMEASLTSELIRGTVLVHAAVEAPFWLGYFAAGIAAGRLIASRGLPGPRIALLSVLAIPPAALLAVTDAAHQVPNEDFVTGTGAFLRPGLMPLVLCVTVACIAGGPALLRGRARLTAAIDSVSRHALGIYIVQSCVLAAVGRTLVSLLDAELPVTLIGVAMAVALTLALSIGVVALICRTPLALIVGETRSSGVVDRRRHDRPTFVGGELQQDGALCQHQSHSSSRQTTRVISG